MSPTVSKALRIGVSLGLAALLLFLFLRHVDLKAVGAAIASADRGWLAVAVGISLLGIPLRAWRWTVLFRRIGRVRQWDAISATCIGFAATTLLPARAGEIVRPVVLARKARLPVPPLLASIGLERLIDLVAILCLFVVYALGGWAPEHMSPDELARFVLLRKSAIVFGIATLLGLSLFAYLAARPEAAERAARPFLRLVPERHRERAGRMLASFLEGLGALRSPGQILIVVLSSLLLWLIFAFQLYATLRAFGLVFPFPVSFFVLTWAVMGLAIPTPGGVGGYHAAVAYALTGFYGVGETSAKAFALVAHAISFVPVTLLGLLFLVLGGLSMRSLAVESEPASQ
ncbi:MAG: lysylphosphatidylglycerol synthase transmembrane domain-containing protein [Thermoanaerobaculia bacterium]